VKVAATRLFLLSDVISTGALADAAYCRKLRPAKADYGWMRRVLRSMAVPIGRGGGRGRPLLWRIRDTSE